MSQAKWGTTALLPVELGNSEEHISATGDRLLNYRTTFLRRADITTLAHKFLASS
jgi:hypothetical protein